MIDLSPEKLLVIGLLAMFLIGPEQLPRYAARLAALVRAGRRVLEDTKERLGDELGLEQAEMERLDPRRYHPRRLVRDAWESGSVEPDPLAELARREDAMAARSTTAV